MQLPNDKNDFYERIYVPCGGAEKGGSRVRMTVRTAASVLLCAVASYMAGGVIAADTTPSATHSAIEEAAYVMSYIDDYETYADTAADTEPLLSRIQKLADEYIRKHTGNGE